MPRQKPFPIQTIGTRRGQAGVVKDLVLEVEQNKQCLKCSSWVFMLKKIVLIVLVVFVVSAWIWTVSEWHNIQKRLDVLDGSIADISNNINRVPSAASAQNAHYNITVDMWQIFEKELQDYKQRLRDGKRQYQNQRADWNKILAESKKNLQNYNKFITVEGDFLEEEFKKYDNLLSRAGEQFDALDEIINNLNAIYGQQQRRLEKARAAYIDQAQETEKKQKQKPPVYSAPLIHIESQINGGTGYKTYPQTQENKNEKATEKKNVIRGTVTGSGTYKTY